MSFQSVPKSPRYAFIGLLIAFSIIAISADPIPVESSKLDYDEVKDDSVVFIDSDRFARDLELDQTLQATPKPSAKQADSTDVKLQVPSNSAPADASKSKAL